MLGIRGASVCTVIIFIDPARPPDDQMGRSLWWFVCGFFFFGFFNLFICFSSLFEKIVLNIRRLERVVMCVRIKDKAMM